MDSELSDAELEELFEGFQSQKPESEPEEHIVPTQQKVQPEKKPSEEGEIQVISDETAKILLDEVDKEEHKYDTDLLIQLIKTIPHIQTQIKAAYNGKPNAVNPEIRIREYIQLMLDFIFHELASKYRYSWQHDVYYSSHITAPIEVLEFLGSAEFQEWLPMIREFKQIFDETFRNEYQTIEDTITDPNVSNTILTQVANGQTVQQETRSKFLKYFEDSTQERGRLAEQFTDELINALVFQYIFGVHVLGNDFMRFADRLAVNGTEITYPFEMMNPFLFGWAGKAKQPPLGTIGIYGVREIPVIIRQLQQYKESVAKNAVLCIIKCQFSNWTMRQYDEATRFRRRSTSMLVDTIRLIKTTDPSMECEFDSEEQEDPDINKEYVNAFMEWCTKKPKNAKNPLEIGYPTLNEKFQEWDSEKQIRKKDTIKPANMTTLLMFQRNILKWLSKVGKEGIQEVKKRTKLDIKKRTELEELDK